MPEHDTVKIPECWQQPQIPEFLAVYEMFDRSRMFNRSGSSTGPPDPHYTSDLISPARAQEQAHGSARGHVDNDGSDRHIHCPEHLSRHRCFLRRAHPEVSPSRFASRLARLHREFYRRTVTCCRNPLDYRSCPPRPRFARALIALCLIAWRLRRPSSRPFRIPP